MDVASLRIAVIGTGVIGGSILLRLRDKGFDVKGWDPDGATANRAWMLGLPFAHSLEEALAGRDLAFLAAPLMALPGSVAEVAKASDKGCVLTDVGGSKQGIAEQAARYGARKRFVPGHPLVQTSGVGLWAASPSLLDSCTWVLCPSGEALEAYHRVAALLIGAFGARIVPATLTLHDVVLALASAVPRVPVSVEKAGALARNRMRAAVLGVTVSGSLGAGRVTGTPHQWATDLDLESRRSLRARLTMVRETLDELTAALDDEERGTRLLTEARLVRRKLEERSLVARQAGFEAEDNAAELEFLTALGASGGYLTQCEIGVSRVTYTALHTPGG
ncbi:MAG TPA: prephenate dehydrogenase/arogenate dehydrogenase family protein [Candidatus Limnocylindrales bacterium]|nr:prephenate dehydrogenase/arogenate dehydrogenase family protein [Candidatus Limnocylindrales bacterium]